MAASLRQLVKSKIFRTVKFIPLGGDLLSRLITGCMKRFDIDDDNKLRFTTTFGKEIAYAIGQQRNRVAQDIGVAYKGKYSALLAIMMWAGKVQAPTHT